MYDYDKLKKVHTFWILILTTCTNILTTFGFVEYLSMFTFNFIMDYDEEGDVAYALMIDVKHSVYL